MSVLNGIERPREAGYSINGRDAWRTPNGETFSDFENRLALGISLSNLGTRTDQPNSVIVDYASSENLHADAETVRAEMWRRIKSTENFAIADLPTIDEIETGLLRGQYREYLQRTK